MADSAAAVQSARPTRTRTASHAQKRGPSEPPCRVWFGGPNKNREVRYIGGMPRAAFDLQSPFKPAGDQPKAIAELSAGLERGDRFQTLLGVTGSGKTMTIANVIRNVGRPTLVLSHNKTLAAQL